MWLIEWIAIQHDDVGQRGQPGRLMRIGKLIGTYILFIVVGFHGLTKHCGL